MGREYYDLHSRAAAAFAIRFVLGTLATWRASHLLASEDGPWEIFARARRRMRSWSMGPLLDCFGCVSLWVAALVSLFLSRALPDVLLCWFAVSGAAFLLELMRPQPVVIETAPESSKEEVTDGMLR